MQFSKVSKHLRLVGGTGLLVLAYAPVFFGSLDKSGVCRDIELSRSDSQEYDLFLSGYPLVEENMLNKLGSPVDSRNDKSLGIGKTTSKTDSLSESVGVRNVALKDIKSGPCKGAKFVKGVITSNFYADARRLGIPAGVIDKVISKLSGKIDFRRSLKKGDYFEVAFDGKRNLLYSKIKTKKKESSIYKFEKEGYFFENGEKLAAGTSGTFGMPLKGKLKISSPYGVRKHPIFKRYHRHTGVDFSAGYGTPVYAVCDGKVTRASNYSGYGKCIDISHRSGYSSRYGHLSRYAVRVGSQVKKGQLIGFSGSSGFSTGPHLHLELARNNSVINPLSVKMIPAEVKKVSNARKFTALKKYFQNLAAESDVN